MNITPGTFAVFSIAVQKTQNVFTGGISRPSTATTLETQKLKLELTSLEPTCSDPSNQFFWVIGGWLALIKFKNTWKRPRWKRWRRFDHQTHRTYSFVKSLSNLSINPVNLLFDLVFKFSSSRKIDGTFEFVSIRRYSATFGCKRWNVYVCCWRRPCCIYPALVLRLI